MTQIELASFGDDGSNGTPSLIAQDGCRLQLTPNPLAISGLHFDASHQLAHINRTFHTPSNMRLSAQKSKIHI